MNDVLERLAAVIEARRHSPPGESYVAGLLQGDIDRLLKKVGEEAVETLIAAKGGLREQVIYETADLWFHSLVLLKYMDIEPGAVLAELEQRFGRSGLAEKASRSKSPT